VVGMRQQLNRVTSQSLTLPNAVVWISDVINMICAFDLTMIAKGQPGACTEPFLLLLTATAEVDQPVIDSRVKKDICRHICVQTT